jgi:tetratricopeptide (TPR) repeat protein
MDLLGGVTSTGNLFNSLTRSGSQLEQLANTALSNGIDRYMDGDYKGAVNEFQRSIGLSSSLSSQSGHAVDAANYMANSYRQMGETDKAIKAYERAISLDPYNDETHLTLGNFLYSEERYSEAESEYKEAIRLNPASSSYYSLGQAYLESGKYNDAENVFEKVKRLEPDSPNGDFGLGQVYSKQERYEDAIAQFKEAIGVQEDFYYGYSELGFAYADSGRIEEAREVKKFLDETDASLANTLNQYINRVEPPKFLAGSSTTFTYVQGAKTPLSSLNAYLLNADASKSFSMKLSFSKDMDRASVEDRFNWKIQRASGSNLWEKYNFGMNIPSTEAEISLYPDFVYYDAEKNTATLKFTIQQNADADGTIDPSHIVFKFNGKDLEGLAMDSDYDEFSGFSGVA